MPGCCLDCEKFVFVLGTTVGNLFLTETIISRGRGMVPGRNGTIPFILEPSSTNAIFSVILWSTCNQVVRVKARSATQPSVPPRYFVGWINLDTLRSAASAGGNEFHAYDRAVGMVVIVFNTRRAIYDTGTGFVVRFLRPRQGGESCCYGGVYS